MDNRTTEPEYGYLICLPGEQSSGYSITSMYRRIKVRTIRLRIRQNMGKGISGIVAVTVFTVFRLY